PLSNATTFFPAFPSSAAMTPPAQPVPTTTTSTLSCFFAILFILDSVTHLPLVIPQTFLFHLNKFIFINVFNICHTRPWILFHFPAHHIFIATINWISICTFDRHL